MYNPSSIITEWQRRLVAMAENPPYVFRDTPQQLVDEHQRQLTTFVGYLDAEIAAFEERRGVRLPTVFRTWLLEMGRACGDLFCGSDLAGPATFDQFRANAIELLALTDPSLRLPDEAVVYQFHQGYTFLYVLGIGGFEGPVLQWMEGEHEPQEFAPTFATVVEAELSLMEENDAAFRERGGYYKTLHPDGGGSEEYPAANSGDRPLDWE